MSDPIDIRIHGKPVILTGDTIDATWQWYADLERSCAAGAKAGDFRVNNLADYLKDCEARAIAYEAHEGRMGLGFIQQAYYLQSGLSVPLLSGGAA